MSRDKLYINDASFSHAPSASWYNHPDKFDWVRNKDYETDKIVTTNLNLVNTYTNKKVYGWLIEPPALISSHYSFAVNNIDKFEKIFTYDKRLLDTSDKFEFIPIGGCWIEVKDRKIHDKSKLVCTISSNKRMTPAHNFRHEVIKRVNNIDVYGSGYKPIDKKIDVLRDYMFCIVMENEIMDYLFTEKLIDCFITGTIPIYYGCPSIHNFFNINGILQFNTIEELQELIPKLTEELYKEKIESIKENFELSKKYLVADNIVYEKIKNGK